MGKINHLFYPRVICCGLKSKNQNEFELHVSRVFVLFTKFNNKQLWYFKQSGGLYCYDISSGKSWCDNTTDHFAIRTSAGFSVSGGGNQITFKNNQTMFVSTYQGEILQFDLPTTP